VASRREGCAPERQGWRRRDFSNTSMSQVTVHAPDGSSRAVPRARRCCRSRRVFSPRLSKAALAGVVNGRLVDLSYHIEEDVPSASSAGGPEALGLIATGTAHLLRRPVTALFSLPCSADRTRSPTRGSSTTSWCRARSCQRIRRDERKMRELASQDLVTSDS